MTGYSAHLYVDPKVGISAKGLGHEQYSADRSGRARLIHPHKYGVSCGNMMHTRIVPYCDPEQVRIITPQP